MSLDQGYSVRLSDLLRVLWLRKITIVVAMVVGTTIFTIAALLVTPTYKVEILLAPTIDDAGASAGAALAGQFGSLASLAGIDFGGGGGAKEEAIALLQSRSFTQQFIIDHNLMPLLFAERWDAEEENWIGQDSKNVPTIWMGIKKFSRIRTVSEIQKTGLVKLAVEWSNPQVAPDWASRLVDQVNEEMRTRAAREAESSIEFLKERLADTDVTEVRQAIYALLESQTKSLMMTDVRSEYAFKILDPAIVPDLNDPTRPNKILLIAVGMLLGLMAGLLIALFPRNVLNADGAE